jgi:hypothetical protein
MSLDMATFASALKQHYTNDKVENMVYMDNPFLAMLPKMENFGGKNLPIPIIFGNPQGRSANFVKAQQNKTNSQLKDFVLTRAKDYSLASIDNETIEASKGDANAFMEAATTEIDGAINSAARSLAIALYGTGSGSIGKIAASTTIASPVIKLDKVESVTNFEVGQTIVLSTADGGGSVKSGSLTVIGVDRDLGQVTVNDDIDNGVATAALADFIFVDGDYDQKVKGLAAWLPATAPTNTPFFSVDRSSDATRLGGIRFDASALSIEEGLIKASSRCAREGGKPSHAFMSYARYAQLEVELGSKVRYTDLKVTNFIGFRGIQINGAKGIITVIADQNCPEDVCYMLQMDVWKLYSLGKAPKILDTDGLKMLRDSSADSVEVRVGYYAQLGSRAPGFNVRIKLA